MTTRSEPLRVPPARLEQALAERRAVRLHWDGLDYVRFSDDHAGFERGTVLVGDEVLATYPRIGRLFALQAGLRTHFPDGFVLEEKLDGYNVRVARIDGRLLPFTRGGFVCPFTCDRLADLAHLGPLFDAHPDLVLCAEVVGPHNPYIDTATPRVAHDVALFAFDLMRRGRQGFVDLAERDRILAEFGVPPAPVLGRFDLDRLAAVRQEVLRLDAEGAEGVVVKAQEGDLRAKYVTPGINLVDILEDDHLLADLPPEFFVNRILRLAIALEELGLEDRLPQVQQRLGEALLPGFLETLRRVQTEGVVSRLFTVYLNDPAAADRLMHHLDSASKKIQVREVSRQLEGGRVRLVFRKVFMQSTSLLKTLLDGGLVYD